MVIVDVEWGEAHLQAFVRDPVRRGDFICGVWCNEHGVGMRTDGCTEDAELRIFRDSIHHYEEYVL